MKKAKTKRRKEICGHCVGFGWIPAEPAEWPEDHDVKCPNCNGTGQVPARGETKKGGASDG